MHKEVTVKNTEPQIFTKSIFYSLPNYIALYSAIIKKPITQIMDVIERTVKTDFKILLFNLSLKTRRSTKIIVIRHPIPIILPTCSNIFYLLFLINIMNLRKNYNVILVKSQDIE